MEKDNKLDKIIYNALLKMSSFEVETEEKSGPTRLLVVGKNSEIVYSNHKCEFELSWQDNNKTLKIFMK